jgi:hypothetical protein
MAHSDACNKTGYDPSCEKCNPDRVERADRAAFAAMADAINWEVECKKLRAENARLRAVLERIVRALNAEGPTVASLLRHIEELARNALVPKIKPSERHIEELEVPCTHADQYVDDDGEWHCLKCEPLPVVPAPDDGRSRRIKASRADGVNALFWCDGEDQSKALRAAADWSRS